MHESMAHKKITKYFTVLMYIFPYGEDVSEWARGTTQIVLQCTLGSGGKNCQQEARTFKLLAVTTEALGIANWSKCIRLKVFTH